MKKEFNKSHFNLTIDMIMFIVLMSMAGIGFLIKYVLIPGFKRNEVYGKDVELYFLGLDRHEWGSVHLVLSLTFIALLVIHIIFHWKMILCIFRKMVGKKSKRVLWTGITLAVIVLFGILPFFVKPQLREYERPQTRQSVNIHKNNTSAEKMGRLKKNSAQITNEHKLIESNRRKGENQQLEKSNHHREYDVEVYGYMTLKQVAKKYGVSVSDLAACINVPEIYAGERLGRLRKRYDFHLNDLRDYIESKENSL